VQSRKMEQAFGKKRLIKDISANTLQTVITQIFALVIFYLTSKLLSKDDFGEYNWSMAVGATIITIASLGLDVVFVKRVSLSKNVLEISGIHFFHTLFVGLILSILILLSEWALPAFVNYHPLFFLVFIYLTIINISNSFRLCLMGLEAYKPLAYMALITNVSKFLVILWLYIIESFTIHNVIYTFILSSMLELLLGYMFVSVRISARVKPLFRPVDYKYFILESLPQLGVVFFDSALARIDWILLGIMSTASITGEYSFAYRMYESSKLPLIIISPILLTRFTKIFNNAEPIEEKSRRDIQFFFQTELYIVMLIPIVLVCSWSPLVDYFTNNKYGQVNELNYTLLAACVPLHCIINFLWSMGFAQGQLKNIMFITIAAAISNFSLNFFMIPAFGSLGASIAFLISTIIQTALYVLFIRQNQMRLDLKTCFFAFFNATIGISAAKIFTNNAIFAVIMALLINTLMALITKQLNIKRLNSILKS
jgi:O-antigen/teichoic acid export membrane protein